MKITLVTEGKIKEKYLEAAIAEYSKRLGRYCRREIVQVADEKTPDKASELQEAQIRDKEGERILAHIKEDAYVIALAIDIYHRWFDRTWTRSNEPFRLCTEFFKDDISTSADVGNSAGTDLPEFPDYKRRTVS